MNYVLLVLVCFTKVICRHDSLIYCILLNMPIYVHDILNFESHVCQNMKVKKIALVLFISEFTNATEL